MAGLNAWDLTVDKENNIWVACNSGVCVFDGSQWKTYTRADAGFIGGTGIAITVDVQGQMWVGTSWEAAVFDGSQWLTYTQATSDLVTNGVHAIASIGARPCSLPLSKGPRTGFVSGKVIRGGVPMVGAEVNLAWEVSSLHVFIGELPCQGEVYKTTADNEGHFSLTDYPIGLYGLAICTPEDEWYTFSGISREVSIISGNNTDLSELTIKE